MEAGQAYDTKNMAKKYEVLNNYIILPNKGVMYLISKAQRAIPLLEQKFCVC